ncbi:hypothetical protein E2C01_067579 [Portunus trituberculatus]|uniref:Uncharacterized protein n=1 Tax=Portunus trituberculatus TaxID=210409 RepID=A0A5B7HU51_PORTR|nr:hypothetical protein [Portunus trituberculatus]
MGTGSLQGGVRWKPSIRRLAAAPCYIRSAATLPPAASLAARLPHSPGACLVVVVVPPLRVHLNLSVVFLL